jgi:hypothetical protein
MFFIFYPFLIPSMVRLMSVGQGAKVHLNWSERVCRLFRLRVKKVGEVVPAHQNRRVMYLFNHRTMADIFLHDVILEGQASFLSRYLVGVVFVTALMFQSTVWFFRRGVTRDFAQFYSWLDRKFSASTRPHLLVYPEGHRQQGGRAPGSLKVGMLKYAYSRQLTVQIGISFGNELACCENPPRVNLSGTDIYYSMDQPINAADYTSEEEFLSTVSARFNAKFY